VATVTAGQAGLVLLRHWRRGLSVEVRCRWCRDMGVLRGCLMCGPARDRLEEAAPWRHPAFRALVRQALGRNANLVTAPEDPAAVGVLLDLLEELLGERPEWVDRALAGEKGG
jgi:hypothetical protein